MDPSTPVPATPLALVPAEDEDPSPRQGFAKPSPKKVTKEPEQRMDACRTVAGKMLQHRNEVGHFAKNCENARDLTRLFGFSCFQELDFHDFSMWFRSTYHNSRKQIECSNIVLYVWFHGGVCKPKLGFPGFLDLSRYSGILFRNQTSLAGSSKHVNEC